MKYLIIVAALVAVIALAWASRSSSIVRMALEHITDAVAAHDAVTIIGIDKDARDDANQDATFTVVGTLQNMGTTDLPCDATHFAFIRSGEQIPAMVICGSSLFNLVNTVPAGMSTRFAASIFQPGSAGAPPGRYVLRYSGNGHWEDHSFAWTGGTASVESRSSDDTGQGTSSASPSSDDEGTEQLWNVANAMLTEMRTISIADNGPNLDNYGYVKVKRDPAFARAYRAMLLEDKNQIIAHDLVRLDDGTQQPIETIRFGSKTILLVRTCQSHFCGRERPVAFYGYDTSSQTMLAFVVGEHHVDMVGLAPDMDLPGLLIDAWARDNVASYDTQFPLRGNDLLTAQQFLAKMHSGQQ